MVAVDYIVIDTSKYMFFRTEESECGFRQTDICYMPSYVDKQY